jgi:uncharacterized membrane protein
MLAAADGLKIGDWAVAKDVAEWIEIVAIAVIAIAVFAGFVSGLRAALSEGSTAAIQAIKHQIGRGLLLGLDLLIAADVIRTVTLEPTLENVTALGVLVVVRTFLAWSLVVELSGRWPWQLGRGDPAQSSVRGAPSVPAGQTESE